MALEVGRKYKVCDGSRKGNIIQITKLERGRAWYETVKGESKGYNNFDLNSFFANALEPIKNETIVIYRNGDETVALDKTTGKKAVAKCHPDDEYDFYTGAMLAFERLVKAPKEAESPHVNCKCCPVREVNRKAKAGEYVKIVNASKDIANQYKNGDVLKIIEANDKVRYGKKDGQFLYGYEYVVLENYQPAEEKKEVFKPFLKSSNTDCFYGYIGEKTAFKDAIGRELKVGDTVELYNSDNEKVGERAVVKTKSGNAFIIGIRYACAKKGTITDDWKIIKKRDYTEVANGEAVGVIVYVKEE